MTTALVSKADLKELTVVGCDGTAVNTGRKGGVIRLLELKVKRPLQWLMCLLHANELPLRHLFQSFDGATTGPRGFSGTLGKALNNCNELPVVEYRPVETDLPHKVQLDNCKTIEASQYGQLVSVGDRTSKQQQCIDLFIEFIMSGDRDIRLVELQAGNWNVSNHI